MAGGCRAAPQYASLVYWRNIWNLQGTLILTRLDTPPPPVFITSKIKLYMRHKGFPACSSRAEWKKKCHRWTRGCEERPFPVFLSRNTNSWWQNREWAFYFTPAHYIHILTSLLCEYWRFLLVWAKIHLSDEALRDTVGEKDWNVCFDVCVHLRGCSKPTHLLVLIYYLIHLHCVVYSFIFTAASTGREARWVSYLV